MDAVAYHGFIAIVSFSSQVRKVDPLLPCNKLSKMNEYWTVSSSWTPSADFLRPGFGTLQFRRTVVIVGNQAIIIYIIDLRVLCLSHPISTGRLNLQYLDYWFSRYQEKQLFVVIRILYNCILFIVNNGQ